MAGLVAQTSDGSYVLPDEGRLRIDEAFAALTTHADEGTRIVETGTGYDVTGIDHTHGTWIS